MKLIRARAAVKVRVRVRDRLTLTLTLVCRPSDAAKTANQRETKIKGQS